jgi:hypothetical protein
MNKLECIKVKSFYTAKEAFTRFKGQSQNGRKPLLKTHLIRMNTPMNKWAHQLNSEFSREELQRTNTYKKKSSTSLVIKGMQIKTTFRFHHIPV